MVRLVHIDTLASSKFAGKLGGSFLEPLVWFPYSLSSSDYISKESLGYFDDERLNNRGEARTRTKLDPVGRCHVVAHSLNR